MASNPGGGIGIQARDEGVRDAGLDSAHGSYQGMKPDGDQLLSGEARESAAELIRSLG